ncbi:hypothetical protein ABN028_28545 [Actinopolymorpha sp. B17G11]|uniref:hypothetical protein n=1 Tax=Actinopolymorpha sp. B17G11 TaxID=3160861 RepID=UPI0032E4A11C
MTFELAKVPGGDVARWGEECGAKALAGVEARDWRPVYDWTKSWIGWGGGAWIPDTWLLYAVSSLLRGQPRNAVHSLDLGIGTWLAGPGDRAGLTWCRGMVVMNALQDPKSALLDLEPVAESLPPWLAHQSAELLGRCREVASRSRKRKPAVKPHPHFIGADSVRHVVAPAATDRRDGDPPAVWANIVAYFSA